MDDIDRALSEMPPSLRIAVRDCIAFESLCSYWDTIPPGPWRTAKFVEYIKEYPAYRQEKYEKNITETFNKESADRKEKKERELMDARKEYADRVGRETGKPQQVRLSIGELGRIIQDGNPTGKRRRSKIQG